MYPAVIVEGAKFSKKMVCVVGYSSDLVSVEESGPEGLQDSSPFKDFETDFQGSPNSALKDRDCGLADVHKVYDSIEAELIRGHLESEGIESFLKSDNAGGTLSYLTPTSGIEIIVRKEDAERAYIIIQDRQS